MALEPAFDNINDLVPANPIDDDPVDEGDNHIRGLKQALQGNVTGDALATQLLQAGITALNADDKGAQVTGQVTVSEAAPLNPEELTRKDFVDGEVVTLNQTIATLQTQVDGLQTQLDNLIDGTTKFTGAQEAPDFTAV